MTSDNSRLAKNTCKMSECKAAFPMAKRLLIQNAQQGGKIFE